MRLDCKCDSAIGWLVCSLDESRDLGKVKRATAMTRIVPSHPVGQLLRVYVRTGRKKISCGNKTLCVAKSQLQHREVAETCEMKERLIEVTVD